jgi:hypothetical protein
MCGRQPPLHLLLLLLLHQLRLLRLLLQLPLLLQQHLMLRGRWEVFLVECGRQVSAMGSSTPAQQAVHNKQCRKAQM